MVSAKYQNADIIILIRKSTSLKVYLKGITPKSRNNFMRRRAVFIYLYNS